jgi:hypothetical protein
MADYWTVIDLTAVRRLAVDYPDSPQKILSVLESTAKLLREALDTPEIKASTLSGGIHLTTTDIVVANRFGMEESNPWPVWLWKEPATEA